MILNRRLQQAFVWSHVPRLQVAAMGRLLIELALSREFLPDYSRAALVELSRFLQVLL